FWLPLDPEFKNFREKERSIYDNDYDMVLKKYKYLKDETKYHLILEELDEVMNRGSPCEGGFYQGSWWFHVAGMNEFRDRVTAFEWQRQQAVMARMIEEQLMRENEEENGVAA